MKNRLIRPVVMLLVVALFAAACGGGSSSDDGGTTAAVDDGGTDTPDETTVATTSAPVERGEDTRDPSTATRADTLILDMDAGIPDDTSNFNIYSGGVRENGFAQVLADPMFLLNVVSGEMEPWLAESVEPNDDASQWTLTLRDGAVWSDGEALTADDVVFTVSMIQTVPEVVASYKFEGATATAVDDVTVQFDLEAGDPRFGLTAFGAAVPSGTFYVVPEHIWSGIDDIATFKNYEADGSLPVVSGPYAVDNVGDARISYIRRNDWWGAATGFQQLPAPLKVEFVAFEGEEQKVAALDQGQLDWATNVGAGAFLSLKQQNPLVSAWTDDAPFGIAGTCPRGLYFNNLLEPFDNPDVRWGIAHLLNRQSIIDVGYGGFGAPPSRHFFPDYDGLNRLVELLDGGGLTDKYPFGTTDETLAAGRFESAGLTNEGGQWMYNGSPLSITITNFDDPIINNLNSVIVEQLTAAGISAQQDTRQIPDFIDGLQGGTLDAYVFFNCGSTVDPWQSMNAYNVSHLPENPTDAVGGFYSNTVRWSSDNAVAYSGLVDQISGLTPGDPAIDDLFVQAMELWLEDLPEIPLAQNPAVHPYTTANWAGFPSSGDPYIQGIVASPAFPKVLNRLNPAG